MLQKQSRIISNNSSSIVIKRKAIDSFGCLGSLYDGYRDRLLEQCNINTSHKQVKPLGSAKCIVINGNSDASRNLLRTIDIEDDLRLSLLLNLAPNIGIATVLNYPYRIDEYTRLLYYSWVVREEQVTDDVVKDLKLSKLGSSTNFATHIITGINYGIDAIIILQLSTEINNINEIDHILQKISHSLSNDIDILTLLTAEQHNLLTKTIKITAYSNVSDLTGVNKVPQLFHLLDIIKKKPNQCPPITYSLQSLKLLNQQSIKNDNLFQTLPFELSNNFEQYILHQRSIITNLHTCLQEDVLKFLSGYLEGKLYGIHKQYSHIAKTYLAEIERLSELLIRFRRGYIETSIIQDTLMEKKQIILRDPNNELLQNLIDLELKAYWINNLLNRNFEYCNVIERDITKFDNETTIQTKLIMDNRSIEVLCSNDILNKNNPQQLKKLLSILIEERKKNPSLRLIYADFTYSSYKLQNMMILSLNNNRNNRDIPTQSIHSQPSVPLHIKTQPPAILSTNISTSTTSLQTNEMINILLLGETGVGKSTFINALVNYLTFTSLKQAHSNKPIAVIPVSFTMTIGDHFEERKIKFGKFDNLNNENFNTAGHSVTQHCKSYIFDFRHINGKKLRIIDTPGFGDTRGLNQDDRNIEHILQYINNLTHLNAICFLLKPNSSRLNISFRTCLTQLSSFLNPDAQKNIIFCFTNSRTTFYTPGDTAPLLKTMLKSLSIDNIPFKKDNTFCFDNESFRYLIALQNGILFNNEDKHEYEMSWLTSVKESNRLIDYICRNLKLYSIENGWQSNKHAQFEIIHMIRPILETIRNILRNLILCKMNLSNISIELCPKSSNYSIATCFSCKRHPIQIGQFWIIPDYPHKFENKCYACTCPTNHHILSDYVLEYRAVNHPSNYQIHEIDDILNRICFASAEFSYFLIHGVHFTKDDLFMLGLLRMIRKEKDICAEKKINQMNLLLVEELEKFHREYKKRIHEVSINQNRKKLAIIYEQIKIIRNYPEIHHQLIAIKQGQEENMRQHEIIV